MSSAILIIAQLSRFSEGTTSEERFTSARNSYKTETADKVSQAIRSAPVDSMNDQKLEEWLLNLVLEHSMVRPVQLPTTHCISYVLTD